jgi:hypothetical protein
MMRRVGLLLAALFAALTFAAPAASAEEIGGAITGEYALAGATASGDGYQGSVEIAPNGRTFRVQWTRPAPLEQRGFALRLDNVLGVVADDPSEDYGIVLYRVNGGHLEGIWQSDHGSVVRALGDENLDGPAMLEGRFEISLGRNPDGSQYGGWVEIKRAGAIYLVDWYTPQPRYIGTGILMGNVFVVGYGAAHRSGVAAFCLQNPALMEGITGAAADDAIGAEVLWPFPGTPVVDPAPRLRRIRERGTADCAPPIAGNEAPQEPLIVTSR